jgi:glycosyltransferase involved in cell wall biosynthesis
VSPAELTVIVTAHNRADLVEDTLSSLADQAWDGDWRILLVDNDSTDATPEILERWIDKMPVPTQILTATDGHSCAYARNAGVASIDSTSFAFVDDDDILAPGWVAAMGEALRTHEYVASRCDYVELNDPDVAALHTFQTERLGRYLGVDIVDGAGSGMRRDLWRRHGGNDERLGFSEDADLGLRVAAEGRARPHFCADAVCHVRLRTDASTAWSRGTRRGFAEVQIHDRHREHFGFRADRPWIAAGRWLRLLAQIPALRTAYRRHHWIEQLGRRVGRLRGSLRLRRWYP